MTPDLRQLIRDGRYEVKAELVAEAIMRWWEPRPPGGAAAKSSPRRPEQLQFGAAGTPSVTPRVRAPGLPGV